MNKSVKIVRFLSNFLIIGLMFFILSSCVSRKKTILFQKTENDSIVNLLAPSEYLLECGDVIYIKVQSLDANATAFINGPDESKGTNAFNQSEQYLYFNGYEVNPNGMIHLPYIDSIKISGMTTDQVAGLLTDSLSPFIKDALVTVKLASFKVSVFGEVQSPGTFLFYRTRVSIFDLIALAKPTEYYNATNVVITRQISNNRMKIERVDLTSSDIFKSQYYYIKPNDQIYIEPLKVKKFGFNTFPYGLILSTISTILVVISIFR